MSTYLQDFQWRYATKKMSGEPVDGNQVNRVCEAIRLAPSSVGLQPFEVWIIESPELRSQIRPIAHGQSQITDCSHLLLFSTWTSATEPRIQRYSELIRERGQKDVAPWVGFVRKQMETLSGEALFHWFENQTMIALGFGIAAAALERIDATPIEGYDHAALDQLLELGRQELKSSVLLALGHRDSESDWSLKLPKMRRTGQELFRRL